METAAAFGLTANAMQILEYTAKLIQDSQQIEELLS